MRPSTTHDPMQKKKIMKEKSYDLDLKDLKSQVRKKALEIASDLENKERYTKEEAINKAIEKAKEWHFYCQG